MSPEKNYDFFVTEDTSKTRIDLFLSRRLPSISRSYLQKLIHNEHIKVNDKIIKASYKLDAGDHITVKFPRSEETNLLVENIPLDIVYEDKNLLVINKPAGMVVHPGAGVYQGTLVNALLYHCKDLSGIGGRLRPGIVHRLDKNTSGLIAVAKDDFTHRELQKQFAEKSAQRIYKALVWGHPQDEEGELETYVNRSKSDRKKFAVSSSGKLAVTRYKVEERYDFLTLMNVMLKTGRTHQIRLHLNYLHNPVFGDPEYSGRQKQVNRLSSLSQKKFALYLLKLIDRQALHAYHLAFEHPVLKKWLEFSIPLADDFKEVLIQIRKQKRVL